MTDVLLHLEIIYLNNKYFINKKIHSSIYKHFDQKQKTSAMTKPKKK